jgi:hypothetical protein
MFALNEIRGTYFWNTLYNVATLSIDPCLYTLPSFFVFAIPQNTGSFMCTLRDLIATPSSQCVDITPYRFVGEVAAESRRTPYIPHFIHEKFILFCLNLVTMAT